MRHFVCVYYGRTGSSWLMNTIASVPRVLVPAFEPLEAWSWPDDDDGKIAWLATALDPPDSADAAGVADWERALRRAPNFHGLHQRNFDTIGFKMSLGSISDHDRLLTALHEAGPRLLFVERHNRIKHALSLYRAHEEGKDQFTGEGLQPPTRLDLGDFDRWLERSAEVHAASTSFRTRFRGEVLAVAYEDFADDAGKPDVIERVARFLRINAARMKPSSYRKVTSDTLADAIVNYDEVRERYADGPFAEFF